MAPEFPIRILDDEGGCTVIDSPEELMGSVDSIDSVTDRGIWIRDVLDRTVRLRMRGGHVIELSVDAT